MRKIAVLLLLVPVLMVLLGSCTKSNARYTPLAACKAPQTANVQTEYRIQPGDMLDIKFFYNPDLNESVTVRPDGRISLQLANDVEAADRTPGQLTDLLKQKYEPFINRPEVAVILRSFSNQRVYVDGEVERPGLFPLTSPTTALQAVAMAGGFKESAKESQVIIIRRQSSEPQTIVINLEDAKEGKDMGQDTYLVPYDIVFVPKSPIGNINRWVDLYLRRNIPVGLGFGLGYELNNNN